MKKKSLGILLLSLLAITKPTTMIYAEDFSDSQRIEYENYKTYDIYKQEDKTNNDIFSSGIQDNSFIDENHEDENIVVITEDNQDLDSAEYSQYDVELSNVKLEHTTLQMDVAGLEIGKKYEVLIEQYELDTKTPTGFNIKLPFTAINKKQALDLQIPTESILEGKKTYYIQILKDSEIVSVKWRSFLLHDWEIYDRRPGFHLEPENIYFYKLFPWVTKAIVFIDDQLYTSNIVNQQCLISFPKQEIGKKITIRLQDDYGCITDQSITITYVEKTTYRVFHNKEESIKCNGIFDITQNLEITRDLLGYYLCAEINNEIYKSSEISYENNYYYCHRLLEYPRQSPGTSIVIWFVDKFGNTSEKQTYTIYDEKNVNHDISVSRQKDKYLYGLIKKDGVPIISLYAENNGVKYNSISLRSGGDSYSFIVPVYAKKGDKIKIVAEDVYGNISEKIYTSKITNITTIGNIKLLHSTYGYNGEVNKPTVKVYDTNGKLISNKDYSISYSGDCINVGTYTVNVALNGTSDSHKINFKIIPKNTSIAKVSPSSKGFTVSLKKYTTQTTGYQIQYATNSKFSDGKTIILKNTITSKKITNLTSRKKYYVRVRTYKKVNGKNYYSSWSKAKAVITL